MSLDANQNSREIEPRQLMPTTAPIDPPSRLESPQFLHPLSIIFEVLSHVRQYIVPAAFGLIGAANGSFLWTGIAAVVFSGALASTLLRYFSLRYSIQGGDFVVTEGLIFKRIRSVPIRRIQNMDLVQNLLHRIFSVAEVRIETASGTKPEATLRILTQSQIEELRQALFGATDEIQDTEIQDTDAAQDTAPMLERSVGIAQPISAETTDETPLTGEESRDQKTAQPIRAKPSRVPIPLYQISLWQLVQAGLCSNRGMVLIGIVIGFFFQNGYDFEGGYKERRFNLDFLRKLFPEWETPMELWQKLLIGAIVLFLALRVLGVAWYVLRFFGYRLTRSGEDLRISCGLFTKVSATIPRKRIQFISIHRPIFMRWLKLASIRVETAGGAGSESENAAATVSRRWFLPVVADSEVSRLLSELRPDIHWEEESRATEWFGVSPLASRRLLRIAGVASAIVGCIGLAASQPWGWAAGIAAFPFLAIIAIKKGRAKRYARTGWGVAYQSGILNRKLSFAFYDRIQTLSLKRSPFDARWQMATLQVDTAAAGPAEHTIDVDYLDAEFALQQFNELQAASALNQPSWN